MEGRASEIDPSQKIQHRREDDTEVLPSGYDEQFAMEDMAHRNR
jgi:hypothetical protein